LLIILRNQTMFNFIRLLIHMKKTFSILILILSVCFGCSKQINKPKSDSELSIKEKDSVFKTIELLCGGWEYYGEEKEELENQGIYFLPMMIECLIEIDNNKEILLNQINIIDNSPLIMSNGGIEIPKSAENIFFRDSDSATITKRKEYYGLVFHKQKTDNFIPIKILNDSLLLFVDGRKYLRIN
jgi:hypothetical protein